MYILYALVTNVNTVIFPDPLTEYSASVTVNVVLYLFLLNTDILHLKEYFHMMRILRDYLKLIMVCVNCFMQNDQLFVFR